jgi:hypothetical protein
MEQAHSHTLAEHLAAAHVAEDDVGDYNVSEAGWYAVDDGENVVLGPFDSLAECERAMRDRESLQQWDAGGLDRHPARPISSLWPRSRT